MSQSSLEPEAKVEIQKLVKRINEDMVNLKEELSIVKNIVKENSFFTNTPKLVNEKLALLAKEMGIDIEAIGEARNVDEDSENADDDNDSAPPENASEQSNNESERSNVDDVADAADKLAEKMKRTLKK